MFCAAIAVAGSYSCAHAQTVRGTDDQTAFAVPRIALSNGSSVALPQPLAPGEAARIRQIFASQDSGALNEAVRETSRLDNTLLLGPILADRYLGGRSHPSAAELTDWLVEYGEQPDAPAIRALLGTVAPGVVPITDNPNLRSGLAPGLLQQDAVAAPRLRSQRGGSQPLLSAGLAAWRASGAQAAFGYFQAAYQAAPIASLRAAGAFWAARAAQREDDHSAAVVWLRRAAQEIDTFYGRIAARMLGPSIPCQPGQTLGPADIDALRTTPGGRRAFALLQVGQKPRAEAELRGLWADAGQDDALARPLALVARAIGLAGFAEELRTAVPDRSPPPVLYPAGGFIVDPSLVYALVHHESNFRAGAVSSDGASGLMQIKPNTARSVGGERASRLHDPAVNLALGQRYLVQLSEDETIDGDLIRLLAGYKQGLYAVKRWADNVDGQDDPLMFMEAIPQAGTRAFIQDILAWSWRYATALKLPTASLDALGAGRFPQLVVTDAQPAAGAACREATALR
jgi:soluble lytic murein transglycosylase